MTRARSVPLLLAALSLAGCAETPPPAYMGRYAAEPLGRHAAERMGRQAAGRMGRDAAERVGRDAPESRRAPADDGDAMRAADPAASLPPEAGRIVAVRRTPFANGVSEEIVIEGPRAMAGENRIVVETLTAAPGGPGSAGAGELKLAPATDASLRAELEEAFPGTRMRVSAELEHNRQGPFGYAVGSIGSRTCLYAWQYTAPERPMSLLEGLAGGAARPVSIRVRLCRDLPVATLVDFVRRLSVRDEASMPAAASAARAAPSGDALDVAVGAVSAPGTDDAAAAPRLPSPDSGTRASRSRARRAAVPMRGVSRRRVAARASRVDAPGVAAIDRAGALPRVPLPTDVSPPAVAASVQPGIAARRVPGPAAEDALPLPR